MLIQKHGGITNRPGTQFITEMKGSSLPGRFFKFVRNATDTFLLEFGEQAGVGTYIRFYQNGNIVRVSGVAAWSGATNYVVGDLVVSGGINYYATADHLNHLPPNPLFWWPLSGDIYEIPSPYVSSQLPEVQYVQKGDVITLVHPSQAIRELTRKSTTNWVITKVVFGPGIDAPTAVLLAGGGASATIYWAVTAIADETFEESPSAIGSGINHLPAVGTPVTVTWTPPAGSVRSYNIYRSTDGVTYGYIGSSASASFSDVGTTPDVLHPAPNPNRDPFGNAVTPESSTLKHPAVVGYYQQRRFFARLGTALEGIYGSRTGFDKNFNTSFPLQDDDAVTFTLVGKQANAVMHLRDLGRLVVFTAGEEKSVEGDVAGILRPDAINPRKLSSNGSGILPPIEIDDSALYQQARGSIIRDLKPVSSDSYEGTDLTVFAAHLFQGYTLVDWDYALNPNSIVWVVRSDGTMLGLTYLREHAIWGWHRHDTDGVVENVCVVPEGNEDRVYLIVKRTINGVVRRYIERMASRFYSAARPQDAYFVDCGVTYDGTNVGATTITISGGVNWNETEQVTLTASAGQFIAGDVGNVYVLILTDASGNELSRIRMAVEAYTSSTIVLARASGAIPVGLQGVARVTWQRAVKTLTGLSYLEGKSLSILGDGYVVASPNNVDAAYPTITVSGGSITLPQAYTVIRLGLPYISDMQPLDLDLPSGATIKDKKLLINEVGLYLERSRGAWIGDPNGPTVANPVKNLREWKARSDEPYGTPVSERTDFFKVRIPTEWGPGRFLVRQVDPLPLTILSATPIGYLPQ